MPRAQHCSLRPPCFIEGICRQKPDSVELVHTHRGLCRGALCRTAQAWLTNAVSAAPVSESNPELLQGTPRQRCRSNFMCRPGELDQIRAILTELAQIWPNVRPIWEQTFIVLVSLSRGLAWLTWCLLRRFLGGGFRTASMLFPRHIVRPPGVRWVPGPGLDAVCISCRHLRACRCSPRTRSWVEYLDECRRKTAATLEACKLERLGRFLVQTSSELDGAP